MMELMDVDGSTDSCMSLESYIEQYEGNVRLQRLKFYVDNSPPSSGHYGLLIQTAMECKNIGVYTDALDAWNNTCPLDGIHGNAEWLSQTSKFLTSKVDRLEQDLKNYQLSQDKENIRRTHHSLGDHYYNCGDLSNAVKHYQKSRDYGTTVNHTLDFLLSTLKVSVYLYHWTSVYNYIKKTELLEITDPSKQLTLSLIKGLCEMSLGNYAQACRIFANVPHDHWTSEVISPYSLLIYCTLCAIGSLSRQEYQRLLFENNNFKQYCDSNETIKNCLLAFYNREYSQGLRILDNIKPKLKLDMFLEQHIDDIYSNIRKCCLCQYFKPYLACDLNRMAENFNTDLETLEGELKGMSIGSTMSYKIDGFHKVLRYCEDDDKAHVLNDILAMARKYRQKTQALIAKSAILKSGLVIKDNVNVAISEEKPSTSS